MTKQSLCNKLNKALSKLTWGKYFPDIPLKSLGDIFNQYGVDIAFLDGIYCGRSGETSQLIPIGDSKSIFWRMTWYKMESGNYEIVCYVSC